jgi:antitoxin component YwqK of YwqJK toxin-antitoxin module
MHYITLFVLLISVNGFAQYKDYNLNTKGDTINIIDAKGYKQGKWINRIEENMGEPGFQEEGKYKNNEKEGNWNLYSLMGDPIGLEVYSYGQKNGKQQYFDIHGNLTREESWMAITPDNMYDTVSVPDWRKDATGNTNKLVVVKLEGNSLRDGSWKYYDDKGKLVRSEKYIRDRMEESTITTYDFVTGKVSGKEIVKYDIESGKPIAKSGYDKPKTPAKPKQVNDFEKTKKGKKKKYQDGSTG